MKCPYCCTAINLSTSETLFKDPLLTTEDGLDKIGYSLGYGFCPECNNLIKTIRSEANKTSIVFQNSDENICKNVLMTGDITNGIMKKIAENSLTGSVPLKKNYYCIKVPHHGTETHYFNFGCHTVFQNLLISNGETNKPRRRKISKQYNLLKREYNIVCTNSLLKKCECFDVFPKITCSNVNDKCNCKFYRDILIL